VRLASKPVKGHETTFFSHGYFKVGLDNAKFYADFACVGNILKRFYMNKLEG
jgi:hypothetical protein